MDDKKLQALIKKNVAKAEVKAKLRKRPHFDATLEATRPPEPEDDSGEAEEIFKEMKRRSF